MVQDPLLVEGRRGDQARPPQKWLDPLLDAMVLGFNVRMGLLGTPMVPLEMDFRTVNGWLLGFTTVSEDEAFVGVNELCTNWKDVFEQTVLEVSASPIGSGRSFTT